jgi:phosphoribosylanthranilate isomerase
MPRALSFWQDSTGAARVKICGVTNWPDAKLAVDLGADALGFNFCPLSPRSISPAGAWQIIRRLPPGILAVGVFVDWPADVVAALAGALRLGAVQLHGSEAPEVVAELAVAFRVIKAFPVRPGFRLATLGEYTAASAVLLDGFRAGLHGGTGATTDWQLAGRAVRYGRVILAGGIKPGNVARAIAEVRPHAVDVASGAEARPGKKDPVAMRELMEEIQSANRAAREAKRRSR